MHWISSLLLGLVEGFTEFIPVSSSGHLIILRQLLGIQNADGLSFDAIIQLATILAVIVYFRKDLWKLIRGFFDLILKREVLPETKTLLWGIILGTIPAVIFGLLLEKTLDTTFRNIHLVAWALIAGSILFWCAERFSKQNALLSIKNAVIIGFFQCLALVPGVSRSGATISGGLFQGLSREEATRFSFLLSIPVLVGSGIKKVYELHKTGLLAGMSADLMIASMVAFVAGLASIHFLITYLKKHSLKVFIVYRIVVAVAVLLFL